MLLYAIINHLLYRIAFEKILTLILGEGDCLRLLKTGLTVPYFLKSAWKSSEKLPNTPWATTFNKHPLEISTLLPHFLNSRYKRNLFLLPLYS